MATAAFAAERNRSTIVSKAKFLKTKGFTKSAFTFMSTSSQLVIDKQLGIFCLLERFTLRIKTTLR